MFEYLGNKFSSKEELFKFLKANKQLIIDSKKSTIKYADSVDACIYSFNAETKEIIKAESNIELLKQDSFKATLVINTTNIRDSHKDVHLPGLWNKSLQETKNIYLLQEHKMQFDKVITDKVNAFVKNMTWTELGFNWLGNTQALIFESDIEVNRNPFMAEQYAKGYVKNHSVGMRYVKLELAMNSESKFDQEEKAVWDKYINEIINRDEVEEDGYFWAVTEAKVIEGSAVLRGSNIVTPTLSIGKGNSTSNNNEPSDDTQSNNDEPPLGTQENLKRKLFNLKN